MRSVGTIGSVSSASAYQGTSAASSTSSLSSASSAAGFQRMTPGPLAGFPSGRGFGLASPSLSSQTTSTLLQEQDIRQAEQQGHGGGGYGGMKVMRNVEAEEEAGAQEAHQFRKRKKLAKPGQLEKAKETAELDENGLPVTDDPDEADGKGLKANSRDVWGWL